MNPDNAVTAQRVVEWFFFILQVLGGQIGLGFLLVTFLFFRKRGVVRSAVVTNFCLTWIISSIVYSLALYPKRTDKNTGMLEPSRRLCAVQASLIGGVQCMTALSTLALIGNLWITLMKPHIYSTKQTRMMVQTAFIIIPYVVLVVIFLAMFINAPTIGYHQVPGLSPLHDSVLFTGPFYCIEGNVLSLSANEDTFQTSFPWILSTYIFTTIICIITLLLEVSILRSIWVKRFQDSTGDAAYKETFIRVLIYTIYRVITLIAMSFVIHDPLILFDGKIATSHSNPWAYFPDMCQAGVPLLAFLVLASRTDILRAWGLRKQKTNAQVIKIFESEQRLLSALRDQSSAHPPTPISSSSGGFLPSLYDPEWNKTPRRLPLIV